MPLSDQPGGIWTALVDAWTWRMAWRDSRTERYRLAIFSLAIIAGVAALVSIHSLKASLKRGIATQAKALLGADLQITSHRPFAADEIADLSARGRRIAQEVSFSSMLYFPDSDAARLVQVRGIEGDFPFYGAVRTTPPEAWGRLHSEPGIVLERATMEQYKAKEGQRVKLGALELPILGAIDKPPPRGNRFGGFAPEAYVRLSDLDRTGLLAQTSLASFHIELELRGGADAQAIKREIADAYPDAGWRMETPEDRRETLGNALDNFEQFLGIVAIAALVLGAIGVAGAVHAHVSRRVPAIAILRCLGCSADRAFAIYLVQTIAIAAPGAAAGCAFGMGLHALVIALFRESLPVAIDARPEWIAAGETTFSGFAVCCCFAVLPLLRIRRISPSSTLRDGAAPADSSSSWRTWPVYLVLAALLVALALLGDPHWKRALSLVAGLGAAFAILAGLARGLVFLARRAVRPRWPYLLRQGISNIHRPRNQTLLFLLSLGLGAFLLCTILLSKNLVSRRIDLPQFAESPNLYLIDVQPDQVEGVSAIVKSQRLEVIENAPLVAMRIRSVRGVPVRELEKRGSIPKWVLQREFRSSYRDRLNATEKLVAGNWFDPGFTLGAPTPLSLEEEIAKDLHVGVGDELTLDVQGVPIKARIASLRKVDWSRFNLNFFMIFPPGALDRAPGFHVLTTRLPAGRSSGELQRALVQAFPNVSAIDLTLVLETVRGILEKVERVLSVLAGFTVLAAIPILAGALLNGRDQRIVEGVLLRTLGASASQVRAILTIEYATLGALSATAGLLLAAAANYALAIFVFKVDPTLDARVLAGGFAITTGLAVAGGLFLSRGISSHPPLAILRGAG